MFFFILVGQLFPLDVRNRCVRVFGPICLQCAVTMFQIIQLNEIMWMLSPLLLLLLLLSSLVVVAVCYCYDYYYYYCLSIFAFLSLLFIVRVFGQFQYSLLCVFFSVSISQYSKFI